MKRGLVLVALLSLCGLLLLVFGPWRVRPNPTISTAETEAASHPPARELFRPPSPESQTDPVLATAEESADTRESLNEPVPEERSPPTGIAIRGVVRDDLGAPIDRFRIVLGQGSVLNFLDGEIETREHSFENAAGRFELGELSEGTWILQADSPELGSSPPLEVVVAEDLPEVELVLPRPARIEGIVFDAEGKHAQGAEVFLIEETDWGIGFDWSFWPETGVKADEAGSFVLSPVRPGVAHFYASSSDEAPSAPDSRRVTPGETVAGVELHLRRSGQIIVEVVDTEGRGEPRREVKARGFELDLVRSQETDFAGRAGFSGLPPGDYEVRARASDEELASYRTAGGLGDPSLDRVEDVELLEGESLLVTLEPPAPVDLIRVSGRATIDGVPCAGAELTFAGGEPYSGNGATTDERGFYALTVHQPGQFDVRLVAETLDNVYCEFVEIPAAPSFAFDVALFTGGIAGTVTSPDGKPVPGIKVKGNREESRYITWSDGTTTQADGTYELRVPTGTYRVVAAEYNQVEPSPGRWAPGRRDGIVVTAGRNVTGVDFVLREGARLECVVRDPDGTAVPGVDICAHDGEWTASDVSDDEGRVRFERLVPTRVLIYALSPDWATKNEIHVELASGAAKTIEVDVFPTTTVTIHVVDASGQPVETEVELLNNQGEVEWTRSSRGGLAEFSILPGLSYTIRASLDGRTVTKSVDAGEGEFAFELRF